MANVNVTSNAWTEISITSGTVQNISATADIELSAEQTDNSGVVLKPSELYQWDNATIYARAVTEETGALRVVNFKRAAGGGGYVLPVASSSTLGGVKVGGGLDIDASGVLSAPVSYSTTEKQIGTWIDGKPLYNITIETNTPSTKVETVIEDLSSLNIKNVISMNGILTTNNNGYSINYYYDSSWNISTYLVGGMLYMTVRHDDFLNQPVYITFQYTKTTD